MMLTRTRLLLPLACGLLACDPKSQSLGDEPADTETTETEGDPTEAPALRWSQIFDDVYGFDLAQGPDGTIVVVGAAGYHYDGGDSGYFDSLWVGKYDAEGNLLWEDAQLVGEASTTNSALAVGPAGEVFVSVLDFGVLSGGGNVVRKLDADGNELWTAPLLARPTALAARPDGGVLVGGAQDVGGENGIAWVQSYDADGNPGWERTFGDPTMRYSEISTIGLTTDGGAVLGGRLGTETQSSRARAWMATVELADGSSRWESLLSDGVATDGVYDLGLAADGTVLALGATGERWVKAIDPAGAVAWTWPLQEVVGAAAIGVDPDGGFSLGDGVYLDVDDPNACWGPSSPCPIAMRVARFDPSQQLEWSLTDEQCRIANVTAPTADGGLLVLASCDPAPDFGPVAMGLLRYEP